MNNAIHPFSTDRPIVSRDEDRLGRSQFANDLANSICRWKSDDSLVIALYGNWGSGKSSIKNMTLEALKDSPSGCPTIVEFNPWQWAGHEQLSESFFSEIGKAIGKENKGKTSIALAKLWKKYSSFLKAGSFFLDGFRKAVFWLLLIIGGLGLGGAFLSSSWFTLMAKIVGIFAVALAIAIKWSGLFAERVAIFFEASAEAANKTLSEIKEELNDSLRNLEVPLLVVIDDIDRLAQDEIALLFKLVKANADFPNIIYILLFQRDIVEKSLDAVSNGKGAEFLEKIVQMGLDIPMVERSRLETILFQGLDELLAEDIVRQHFDQTRWGNVFVGGMREYFETLRDVKRFLSSLTFHIGLFNKNGAFEVNPVDLFALETIRLFEPGVYHRLRNSKELLTAQRDRHDEGQSRQQVENIIKEASHASGSGVKEILAQLFPQTGWVFGGSTYGSDFYEGWFRELRICSPERFDTYFYLSIAETNISQADLEKIVALAGDRERLVAELRSLGKRGLLGVVVDRLEAYKQKISLQFAIPFVTALFDIGDDLPEEQSGGAFITPEMHLYRIIYWYLKQEEDTAKRLTILVQSVNATTGLAMPAILVSFESDADRPKKSPTSFLVDESSVKQLQDACLDRIRKAAASGLLYTNRRLAFILFHWHDWAGDEEPRSWVGDLISTDEGLLIFLVAFLERVTSTSMGDKVSRVIWRIRLSSMEKYVDPDGLKQRISQLDRENLTEQQRAAVDAYHKAVKRQQEGKEENGYWLDND